MSRRPQTEPPPSEPCVSRAIHQDLENRFQNFVAKVNVRMDRLEAFTGHSVDPRRMVIAHAGGGANWILSTYALQATVPDALRGRVFSADYTLATLVIAGSQVVFGLLSDHVPARDLLAAAGAVVLLYAGLWQFIGIDGCKV